MNTGTRYASGWLVTKFPSGIEDYADWTCRASEITEKNTFYYRDYQGAIQSETNTRTFFTNEVVSGVAQPVLRSNILYTGYGDPDIPSGNPKIKHNGISDFSMGGSIDLYNPLQSSYVNTVNARNSIPSLARKGSTGEGIITDFDFLRMFLFKGDFYVAWFWDDPPDIGTPNISLTVGHRKITTRQYGEYSSSNGIFGGQVEYTITDTFA